VKRQNVLVVGASRGIGLEFVRQYRADGARVVATARSDEGLAALEALGARALRLDVARLDSTAGLAWQLDGEAFDTAIVCAGVFGPRLPGLQAPTEDQFDTVMHTNVLGPMRVIPQFVEALAPGARLVVLSSRLGSIGARTHADGGLYRASKAALNSVLKDTALSLGDQAICVAFHPGWVQTDMGGTGADLTVEHSVTTMRSTIADLVPSHSGHFLDHDGTPIPW
jgi:NAD(P)-dependent dehydrogenase (short-subunit alcohol dehydrogenase family)